MKVQQAGRFCRSLTWRVYNGSTAQSPGSPCQAVLAGIPCSAASRSLEQVPAAPWYPGCSSCLLLPAPRIPEPPVPACAGGTLCLRWPGITQGICSWGCPAPAQPGFPSLLGLAAILSCLCRHASGRIHKKATLT